MHVGDECQTDNVCGGVSEKPGEFNCLPFEPICSGLFRLNWHCVIDKDFSGVWNGTSWSGLINNQWHRQETLKKREFYIAYQRV